MRTGQSSFRAKDTGLMRRAIAAYEEFIAEEFETQDERGSLGGLEFFRTGRQVAHKTRIGLYEGGEYVLLEKLSRHESGMCPSYRFEVDVRISGAYGSVWIDKIVSKIDSTFMSSAPVT